MKDPQEVTEDPKKLLDSMSEEERYDFLNHNTIPYKVVKSLRGPDSYRYRLISYRQKPEEL